MLGCNLMSSSSALTPQHPEGSSIHQSILQPLSLPPVLLSLFIRTRHSLLSSAVLAILAFPKIVEMSISFPKSNPKP